MFRRTSPFEKDDRSVSLARMVDLLFEYAETQGARVSYQDISRVTGVAWNSIRNIRIGDSTNPSLRTIQAIADYFGVKLDYFNCETEGECRAYLAALAEENLRESEIKMRSGGISAEGLGVLESLQAMIDYIKQREGMLSTEEQAEEDEADGQL